LGSARKKSSPLQRDEDEYPYVSSAFKPEEFHKSPLGGKSPSQSYSMMKDSSAIKQSPFKSPL
jgi:hypothetical protein